jgi:hypothetical protein
MNPKSSKSFFEKPSKWAILPTLWNSSLTTPACLTYKVVALAQGMSVFDSHKEKVLVEITGIQHLVIPEWVSKACLLSRVKPPGPSGWTGLAGSTPVNREKLFSGS